MCGVAKNAFFHIVHFYFFFLSRYSTLQNWKWDMVVFPAGFNRRYNKFFFCWLPQADTMFAFPALLPLASTDGYDPFALPDFFRWLPQSDTIFFFRWLPQTDSNRDWILDYVKKRKLNRTETENGLYGYSQKCTAARWRLVNDNPKFNLNCTFYHTSATTAHSQPNITKCNDQCINSPNALC